MTPLGSETSYLTVSVPSEIEIVEKRSRFIGRCWPIRDEAEALSILERIRRENWDATHNCYAYALKNGAARYSDDGEPSGTAGMPMMEGLKRIGVTDTLVIVTRYFGGILLGAGGLVRMYSKSACEAIKAAVIVRMAPCTAFSVRVPYSYWNTTKLICEQFGKIDAVEYTDTVCTTIWVDQQRAASFTAALTERTEGRIAAEPVKTALFPFPLSEDAS